MQRIWPCDSYIWLWVPSDEWASSFIIYWEPEVSPVYSSLADLSSLIRLSISAYFYLYLQTYGRGCHSFHPRFHHPPHFLAPALVQTSPHAVLPWIALPNSAPGATCHLHFAGPPSMIPFVTVFSFLLWWLMWRVSEDVEWDTMLLCVTHSKRHQQWKLNTFPWENCLVK